MHLDIDEIGWLTPTPEPIWSSTVACCADGFVATWHRCPTEDEPEAVIASKVFSDGRKTGHIWVGRGADPDVLIVDSRIYISWISKDFDSGSSSIVVSIFDPDLNLIKEHTVVNAIVDVFGMPQLAIVRGEIQVLYNCNQTASSSSLRAYNLRTSETYAQEIIHGSRLEDILSRFSSDHLLTVFETQSHLNVMEFDGFVWKKITSIVIEAEYPHRFDFAVGKNEAMFVLSYQESRIASLKLNLTTRTHSTKWVFCDYGKFASISRTISDKWVVSWIGAPALEIEEQGKSEKQLVAYAQALVRISEDVAKSEKIYGSTREKSEIELLFGRTFIRPWVPLWLGILDSQGKCSVAYGPLGNEADESWNTSLSIYEDKGILLWRNFEKSVDAGDDNYLSYRGFALELATSQDKLS